MGHPAGAGLTARDVRIARAGRQVLDGASLTVPAGELTALVAPSGAGKSTLLRCLNRLLEPDEGTIELGGRDVRELDPRLPIQASSGLVSRVLRSCAPAEAERDQKGGRQFPGAAGSRPSSQRSPVSSQTSRTTAASKDSPGSTKPATTE